MNTMLPFSSFTECARVHPTRALHRQIMEVDDCLRHLINDLFKPPRRKSSHPCVEMWRDHEDQLCVYRHAFVSEWLDRTLIDAPAISTLDLSVLPRTAYPEWLESHDLHATYREHMLAKYGTTSMQPDVHFIEASADWIESPRLHKPFPFPKGIS